VSTPLLIGEAQREALHDLRERAARAPVDITTLKDRLATVDGKLAHVDHMSAQTVEIPADYLVTFSIETGHPGGAARHLSMSVNARGRVPIPEALWMVAEELGFLGGLEDCTIWPERLRRGGDNDLAINVVQLIGSEAVGHA